MDFKAFVVHVAAYFTSHPTVPLGIASFIHCLPLSSTSFPRGLCFLDVLMSRSSLGSGWFRLLRHVAARFGFEPVSPDLDRFGTQLFEQIFGILRVTDEFAILYMSIFL